MGDPFGRAILDYLNNENDEIISVDSNITIGEEIPVDYLFRDFNEFPDKEKFALGMCKGDVLDVGAGAGSHALELQKSEKRVYALEISKLACDGMVKRGVEKVINADIFNYSERTFDTILLLMNGIGISGTVAGSKKLLKHLSDLLNPGGKIILESCDISYMYENEDGSIDINLNQEYYGELQYFVSYKNETAAFDWLFIDQKLLSEIAGQSGLNCEILFEGDQSDYIACLTKT
jgi:SAM-dependent methyltransferase